jgi:hypothetical protein
VPNAPGLSGRLENPLRNSTNTSNFKPNKFSYHASKPAIQTEKVGEYVTKEARMQQA